MGHYVFYEWVLLTVVFFQLAIASYVTWVSVKMNSYAIYCGLIAAILLSWVLLKVLYHDYNLLAIAIHRWGLAPPFYAVNL